MSPVYSGESMRREIGTGPFWRDVLSEFVATFFLVSVQCMLPLTWGRDLDFGASTQTGLGMGFIVAAMAWTLGDFGGGHMNPAVTLAMTISLKISFLRAIFYWIAQCVGGIAGAGFVYAITPAGFRDNLAVTALGSGMQPWQGFLTETWITCILVITILGATNARRKGGNVFIPPLIIGLAIALGIMSAFVHTGGSMNPARSLGPAVVMNSWSDHWIYWVGPFAGAILAVIIYVAILDRIGAKDDGDTRVEIIAMKTQGEVMADDRMQHTNGGFTN